MTLPLKTEKGAANCGELFIELDDLHMPMADGTSSPSSESSSDARMPLQSEANHVTSTSLRPPGGVADGEGSSSSVALASTSALIDQANLMSLDTPEQIKRGQDAGGRASAGSSQHPSPTPSPTPPTSGGGRGNMGAVGVAAAAVGVASVRGGSAGGRGSGTNSPAPPTSQSTNARSRVPSNGRPRQSGTVTPPTAAQPRPPAQQTSTTGASRPQQSSIVVRPQQQASAAGKPHYPVNSPVPR